MSIQVNFLLRKRQRFSLRNLQLQLHQIQTSYQFCNRMLHLNTGIHFHEIEVPVIVHQELNGSDVAVIAGLCSRYSCLLHPLPQLRCHQRAGGFLQHLLVAALHAAIPLAQCNNMTVCIGNDLYFYMVRPYNQLFQVNFIVAEEFFGFFLCHFNLLFQLIFPVNAANSTAAAAGRSLDKNRIANSLGNLLGFL